MTTTQLIRARRFLPLFVTQLLGAFNDNLFKNAMILYVVYEVYNSEAQEARFSALASAIFIIPFFLLSALAGQLADMRDKALLIRIIKACEIAIMLIGGAGLVLAWQGVALHTMAIPLMLAALFAMGIHSTFFGPIKYAILPQHLERGEVLAGTGMVEAGTYLAVLAGTIVAGWISVQAAAIAVVAVAGIGFFAGSKVPPAPPLGKVEPLDYHVIRSSVTLVRTTMKDRRVFLAICAISFFWAIGTVLFIQFPPLAKNILMASKQVASLFLVIFSVGVAIGSMVINAMLKGTVSAKWSPISVIGMGVFLVAFQQVCAIWPPHNGPEELMDVATFVVQPLAVPLLLTLLGIAISGGMFVVPLYAFLTTFVDKSQTARTVAANNIVNSGAMVLGAVLTEAMTLSGLPVVRQLLVVALSCGASAWLGYLLFRAERSAVTA
ncbi:MAG: MFS transporter [Novosphingobium sp.]|uniref:2-acyl-glycerophospho-ethanolamine acyltransferase n=1 Tax=Novosphingobium indicum TaxID=462949 RepID=A0ABQ2JIN0_9SPHN|nr:MFS transporter [Novosphingobium indicum]MAC57871.1 MFS transporter [Novosphingobium sp.]GGN47542.1 2-acyl-glycerophospho-ethanolamine acyltransferase [Novosphingobium indicum]|tara:strand:- start:647 stop:1957 length:1311 start_codon:yes stop_codon:yes gene_type:complete